MNEITITIDEYFRKHPIDVNELIDDYINNNRLKILEDSTKIPHTYLKVNMNERHIILATNSSDNGFYYAVNTL